MCKHGTLKEVTISPKPFKVKVDSCIADEIVWLNSQGVYTANSCCGHGEDKSIALIYTNHGSIQKAIELGYEPKPFSDMFWQIKLKQNV
jgi:hypothetical protein